MPPIAKTATAWVGVFTGTYLDKFGIHTWADLSYALASLLSLLFIADWFWKRFWRDKFVAWGLVKPKLRRKSDVEDEES